MAFLRVFHKGLKVHTKSTARQMLVDLANDYQAPHAALATGPTVIPLSPHRLPVHRPFSRWSHDLCRGVPGG